MLLLLLYEVNFVVEKLILFLTDGEPTDNKDAIMKTLRDENAKLGNKVIMFTFGFGEGLYVHTFTYDMTALCVTIPCQLRPVCTNNYYPDLSVDIVTKSNAN